MKADRDKADRAIVRAAIAWREAERRFTAAFTAREADGLAIRVHALEESRARARLRRAVQARLDIEVPVPRSPAATTHKENDR